MRLSGRKYGNLVLLAASISGDQREMLAPRLCYQHPVERVAEGTRQVSGRLSVLHRDRQLEKALKCKRPRDIYRKCRCLG